MQSFDIYTLRMQLRQLGLNIDNSADLRLSAAKTSHLKKHMTLFMQPLMDLIYDETGQSTNEISEVAANFHKTRIQQPSA